MASKLRAKRMVDLVIMAKERSENCDVETADFHTQDDSEQVSIANKTPSGVMPQSQSITRVIDKSDVGTNSQILSCEREDTSLSCDMQQPSTSCHNITPYRPNTIISESDCGDFSSDSSDDYIPPSLTSSDTEDNTPLIHFVPRMNTKSLPKDVRSSPVFLSNILTESDFNCKEPIKKYRWRKAQPELWKSNISKTNKKAGLAYKTRRGMQPAKKPRLIDCANCIFKCTINFSEEERELLCSQYICLDYCRQRDFILMNVIEAPPKRIINNVNHTSQKRKTMSRAYFFHRSNEKVRVCKQFFMKTLSISHGPVDTALKHKQGGIFGSTDKRGHKSPVNKTDPIIINKIKEHILSFPTMESHYCRKSTSRKYLDANLSITKMFNLYKDTCISNSERHVSEITYRRVFCCEFNLSFYRPKKDQCVLCENYKKGTEEERRGLESEYHNHIKGRDDANISKSFDKERSRTDPTFVSASFDLQSVLQIPSSDVSPMYYSRKLCAYKLTIYEAAPPNEGFCFIWSEVNGQRGSSEIGTCMMKWIKGLSTEVSEISLYSDTCAGQNRNQQIAALFLYLVQTTQVTKIQHNFLEKGHSHMEVDSMHSAIESAKKYVSVYTINDWINVMKLARSKRVRNKRSGPYHVTELKYSDFFDLKWLAERCIKNRTVNANGDKVNWLKIKCLRYEKEKPGIILYKYDYNEAFNAIPIYGRGRGRSQHLPQALPALYKKENKISSQKKEDLLKLCKTSVIPKEYHTWYQSLETVSKVDRIPEPASEGSDSE